MTVDYVPAFRAGETSVLFLDAQGRIVGGPQGKLDMVDDRVPALGVTLARLRSRVKTGFTGYQAPQTACESDLTLGARVVCARCGYPIDRQHLALFGFGRHEHPGDNQGLRLRGDAGIRAASPSGTASSGTPLSRRRWSRGATRRSSAWCLPRSSTGIEGSAGSGPVTVTTSSGKSATTTTSTSPSATAARAGRAADTPTASTPTPPTPLMKKRWSTAAAGTWNAASNFRFKEGGSCTTTYKAADYHNDIFWSSTAPYRRAWPPQATVWSDASNPSVDPRGRHHLQRQLGVAGVG